MRNQYCQKWQRVNHIVEVFENVMDFFFLTSFVAPIWMGEERNPVSVVSGPSRTSPSFHRIRKLYVAPGRKEWPSTLPCIMVTVSPLIHGSWLLFCAWQEAYASSSLFSLFYLQPEICPQSWLPWAESYLAYSVNHMSHLSTGFEVLVVTEEAVNRQ